MTENQILSMEEYYDSKYGEPKDDNDAIYKLTVIYKDLFETIPTQDVKDGIAEYYRIINNRGLPAYLWILESLHVTSKKEKGKRNFPYCVGMIRTWLKYGFGHIPNQEEDELVSYFEETTGQPASLQARQVLQTLMGKYGVIKITKMINNLKNEVDMSVLLMNGLAEEMDNTYGEEVQDKTQQREVV